MLYVDYDDDDVDVQARIKHLVRPQENVSRTTRRRQRSMGGFFNPGERRANANRQMSQVDV